ncbi:ABC transporter permease [Cohnella nanjingensis]|uniref:ABC transporter permease n=1 Tax=Cohnella nanjingensis TaxID=1387779 RepID=A0A7X0VH16_9BACL|nr:ABC transporter permease [Cohnella nanjingensis]MBB6673672.1 ABC transporter permease [Cohnella nanjingensis]
MNNLILSEWYKLRKNRSFRSLCLLLIVAAVAYPLFQYYVPPRNGPKITFTGIELFVDAVGINVYFLKITLGVLAGFFISSEYSSGAMKRTASAGSSRMRIYGAKLAVYSFGAVIIALLFPVISVIVGSSLTGFGQLTDVNATEYLFRTLGFTVLFAAAFASIAALLAIAMRDSGKSIGISLVFFLFVDLITKLATPYFPIIKTIYDYSVFNLFMTSIQYRLDSNDDLLLSLTVPVLTFAAFALLGMYAFRRKEIK